MYWESCQSRGSNMDKKIKSTKKFVQVIRFLQPNMSAVSYITFTSIKAGSSTIIESLDWAQVAHF